jgi:SAM-dependent methyltransferase
MTKPDYGNWVPIKLIYGPILISALFLALSFIWPVWAIVSALSLLIGAYFAYAHRAFSPGGGDIQSKIWDLVPDRLNWSGEGTALDIGCGNGPLTIALAKRYPNAHVTGIDYWGKACDYSKTVCEGNAAAEGVADRTSFQKASASALPFEDGSFDAVISNFVFHQVGDTKDKRALVREALRVVKRGGSFAFHDYFLMKGLYGEVDDLLETIRRWGITEVSLEDTSTLDFVPGALRLPFMLSNLGIIYGKK